MPLGQKRSSKFGVRIHWQQMSVVLLTRSNVITKPKWVDWTIRCQGYSDFTRFWNIAWGSSLRLRDSERLILLLSPDFMECGFVQCEWSAVLPNDPDGQKSLLIPIRVQECVLTRLLTLQVYLGIAGKTEVEIQLILCYGPKQLRLPLNGKSDCLAAPSPA
jgi:TIR domain